MKPRKAIPKGKPPKRLTALKRSTKKIRKANPVAKAKRNAKYKAYLSSAAWKQLRIAVFRRDGWRCTNTFRNSAQERGWSFVSTLPQRCPNWDETRTTGKGLVCDHLTYARFGHENLDDLRTLCKACNARLTVSERANWSR